MGRRCSMLFAAGAVATAVGAGGSLASAQGGSIKPMPDRAPREARAAATLARAIASKPSYVRSGAFSALPPFSNPTAISTKRLADFPRKGGSFAILSNGDATEADAKNTSGSHSTPLGGPSVRGSRDVTILRVTLRVPKNVNCLAFSFKFLSDEFPEFVDDAFNDAFIAELDNSTWDTVTKDDPTIVAPDNFAVGPEGRPISVNAQGDTSVAARHAKGTTYDGATPVLRASTRVTPGRHILYLSVFDQGDREYDSAVFVDNLTFSKSSSCESGAVVED